MNEWLWAATVLVVALVPLVAVAVRRPALEGVVALQAAGVDTCLVLLLIAQGTDRQSFVDLALVLALMSFIGTVAFVRFAQRAGG
jgi:multisubunit Na+/H+ antiporter MnhF subunit